VCTPITWSAMVARRAPADAAVITAEGAWDGADLVGHAAGAADWMDHLGIPDGASVPALVTTSLSATALLLAGAGSARPLAPMGPRLTPAELSACLAKHNAPVVVTEPEFEDNARAAVASTGQRVEVIPPLTPSRRKLESDPPADALVLIMHTSGTSGIPKLVPVRQDRMAARVRNSVPLTRVSPGSVYASMSPFQHIAGVGNVLITLAVGAALVGARHFSQSAWTELAAHRVSHALLVPTMIDTLLDDGALALPSLQTLQYGGSPIHPDTLKRLTETLPKVRLVQVYGATEGSPLTCLTAQDHRDAAAGRHDLLLSTGRAAPEVEIRIFDPDADGLGEVWFRSPHIFLPADDGWLHTGDLGHLDKDGYLSLSGRKGDRIIRGGENVDPLQVEQVLMQHPGVGDVAVVGMPDKRLGELVTAFVVRADESIPADGEDLRRFARRTLAGFKLPEHWEFVTELPRNENGKLLRRHLRSKAEQSGVE
jgi:acyl-CoA synthetase (AMP-forming)/AMP-acid ligase II